MPVVTAASQRNRREKNTNAIDEPRINEQTKQTVFNALDCNSLFDIGGAELLERLKERWVIAHDHLHVVFERFSHDCEEGFCFICKNDVARNSCSPLDVKSLVNKTFETFFAFVGSINFGMPRQLGGVHDSLQVRVSILFIRMKTHGTETYKPSMFCPFTTPCWCERRDYTKLNHAFKS